MSTSITSIEENEIFDLAYSFLEDTRKNLFITGRAGTGKTTFLRKLAHHTTKTYLVAAPTGIAALNAFGVTLNSLFQIPPGYFLKGQQHPQANIYDPEVIVGNLNYSSSKKLVLQGLELLVIDEASMVRADQIDLINKILQKVRRTDRPFGGVQLVLIGDLFQLPPVVTNDVLVRFQQVYHSPYFFEAVVLKENPLVKIEFNKIFRQADTVFIELLNRIRSNSLSQSDLDLLNSRLVKTSINNGAELYVSITSHVSQAAEINRRHLASLQATVHHLEAEIKGQVNKEVLPAEERLTLKIGAQVMLLKNDTGHHRTYYNGKIGMVSSISKEGISVSFPDEEDLQVEKVSWPVYDYVGGDGKGTLHPVQVGEFIQYPLRVAWAVTIHKTQGLTFERAAIDAAEAFAPGQVYVALSRVKSLESVILHSPISFQSIQTDPRAAAYSSMQDAARLKETLAASIRENFIACLIDLFSLRTLKNFMEDLLAKPDSYQQRLGWEIINKIEVLNEEIRKLDTVRIKFADELNIKFDVSDSTLLKKRMADGHNYFSKKVAEDWLSDIIGLQEKFANENKLAKQILDEAKALLSTYLQQIEKANLLANAYTNSEYIPSLLKKCRGAEAVAPSLDERSAEKNSHSRSNKLQMLIVEAIRAGKIFKTILTERKISQSILEKHLLEAVKTGQLRAEQVMPQDKIVLIEAAVNANGTDLFALKEKLGLAVSFFQIKVVLQGKPSEAIN